jgi:hypothetical protein
MTMDVNPQSITLISASTAMVASITSLLFDTRIARIQFGINVLRISRQKWIGPMRDLVASLNSQFLNAATVRQTVEGPTGTAIAQDPELFRRVVDLLRTMAKIELMLNSLKHNHQQLDELMMEGVNQPASATVAGIRHRSAHRAYLP